ncbi:MAG TPA: two-component regulator propeller domain-containing protein [Cyclobacteriaceae bacterium]|jgi:ligand-binding sensor domain-containing protein|nr:two-component regulator propeller domain-containing protein [Cyclobacteriaceae bacterium]
MRIQKPFIAFLLVLLSLQSFSQKEVRLQQLSVEDGLSQNTINTIYQDKRGFMWFGTQNGLNKYDASVFTVFKNIASDSTSLPSNDVYAVFEDQDDKLWFGTRSGLALFNRKTDNFTTFDYYDGGQYSMRPVWGIVGSRKNHTLWIGASGGLFAFNSISKKFQHYKISDSIQNANSIRAICQDKTGTLWIGTSIGQLMKFDTLHHSFLSLNSRIDNPGNDAITSIFEDSEGDVWIGRDDGMLVRYDPKHDSFHKIVTLKQRYSIRALLEDKEGNLWVGTDKGGTYLLNKTSEHFTSFASNQETGTDVVLSFYNDAKGDMWLGTYHGGTFLFDKTDTAFDNISPYDEIKNSDESNAVLSIYKDENSLWLGTDGGGLMRKSGNSKQYYKKSNKNSLAGNVVLCMAKGKDDQLYLGTYADGLSVLNKKTGAFKTYNQQNGLGDNSVWVIYPDGDFIWIGTNKGGLDQLDTRTGRFRHFTNTMKDDHTISSNTIRCILKDSRNKMWVGTVSGLNLYNEEDATFSTFSTHGQKNELSSSNILCIYEDTRKDLWFGTHGGGINKYDYRTGTFISYQEKDGLAGNIVYGILEDEQGSLWMSTNKGISQFDVERHAFKNFDTRSGLSTAQFNVGAYYKDVEGRMYFGNIDGVSTFFPHHIRQNSFVPPVVITDFQLFNKPVHLGEDSPLKISISETNEITLNHTQSVFSFKFSALNYTHADKNSFAYKLDPFDKDWNYVDNVHTATYTNLDPGTYTFMVKGSNNDNVWNEKYAAVKIIVTPPYWKTIWFRVLLILTIITTIYAIYRIKVNTIKTQKEILSKLVDQRTREIEERNQLLLESQMKNAQLLNQQLNDELANKSKELTNYTLLIIQKNKLLDELKRKLKEAIRHPGTNNLRDFKNLVKLINYNFSPEKEWNEFNINFNRIHKGFAESLKVRFPDLTNNDLRLCALYCIGIPTKDIAEAMGISQTSVKMARYRLRKKLDLAPEADLTEFLKVNIQTSQP